MRVFFGCHEIASFLTMYSEAFRSLGHQTQTFVFNKNPFYFNNHYDFVAEDVYLKYFSFLKNTSINEKVYRRFKKWYSWKLLKKVIKETDLFVFMWSSLLPDNEDLKYIKDNGKKIIFINCGNEVRHTDPFVQEFKIDRDLWKKDFPVDSLDKKLSYLRNIELYADLILSVPDQSGFALRPYFHLKIPFDAKEQRFYVSERDIPQVVHCPTRRFIKGSDLIESALDNLKSEGVEFNYKKIVNVPNEEILKILVDSDVVVDQLIMPGPGVLGFEAMASGCVVCTRHIPNESSGWIPPVVAIDTKNIYSELKRVLTDKDFRNKISNEGRVYVLKNHDPKIIVQEILHWLKGETKPHYYPRFYLDKFSPLEQKVPQYLKEKSLAVLQMVGCHSDTNLKDSISRGLLPSAFNNESIKRWD